MSFLSKLSELFSFDNGFQPNELWSKLKSAAAEGSDLLRLSRLPSWARNKYSLSLLVFLVWMIFFDQNNFFVQNGRRAELNDANRKKGYYEAEISKISNDLEELLTDEATMEKFAREKHMMKRDNEEIYIIVQK